MKIAADVGVMGDKRLFRQMVRFFVAIAATLLLAAAGSAQAATFTVTNIGDAAGTTCGASCSLRQAMGAANLTAAADIVAFNIAGPGVKTIALGSALPDIVQPLTIDGYTQADAKANTLVDGDNAVILIRLDGSAPGSGGRGISVCASNSVVRGLSTTNFGGADIQVGITGAGTACAIDTADVAIEGSFVGLHPDGVTAAAAGIGILVTSDQLRTRVGGASPAQRNVIVGGDPGINFSGIQGDVAGNYIGTDASGTLDRGGSGSALFLPGTGDTNDIGGLAPNLIAFYARGINAASGSVNNRYVANHFRNLDGIGIDLVASGNAADGITPNDVNDVDTGANNLQNFPENISVSRTATGLNISGRIDRAATATSITFTVGVYANAACNAATDREGERFLGTFNFVSSNQSVETFTNVAVNTTESLPVGTGITLTATDPAGDTSEFSNCINVDAVSPTFTVNKTADTNDGVCNADCSLREAITAANANIDGNIIAFNIPGAGPHTISPTTVLPTVNSAVTIDGYTQPGSVPNTSTTANNAVLRIRLDGLALGVDARGIAICGRDVVLRGLSMTRFNGFAVFWGSDNAGVDCNPNPSGGGFVGGFIGLGPDGAALGNATGFRLQPGIGFRVGGVAPADHSVISDNDTGITLNGADDVVILGNLIGTDPTGQLPRGNTNEGVQTLGASTGIVIGGLAAPNRFAFNGAGINHRISSAVLDIRGNEFVSNSGLGIDLCAGIPCPNGVTPNDIDDADTGANGLQNFPVVSSASVRGDTLTLIGILDVPAAADLTMRLDVYESTVCDANGHGEGAIFLGSAFQVITGGAEAFKIALPNAPALGSIVTMTATDDAGNTSEFSACATVIDGDIVFSNGLE
jgi:CSLREA domain-containing protein